MATPNIVPKADQEGGLGTAAKSWGKLFIENAAAGGTAAATISNLDVDQIALDINASNTTANVLDISATAVTTANIINVDANSLVSGSVISLDVDDALTTGNVKKLMLIDYDKSGITANTIEQEITGLDISMVDAATNHINSTVTHTGVAVGIDAASNQGNILQRGYTATLTDGKATSTIGYSSTVENGGIDFKAMSSANTADFFTISTTTDAATTLATTDADAAAAHLTLAPDGDVLITPKTGAIKMFDSDNSSDAFTIGIGTNGDTTLTTEDAAGANANFEIAADGNITLDAAGLITLEAAGDTISCDTNVLRVTSVTTNQPTLQISRTSADANAGILQFDKDRHSSGVGADGDDIGTILWNGGDGGGNDTSFASIVGEISEADNTDEAGKLTLNVASSNGTTTALSPGLVLEGEHATAGEVDVLIGNRSTSTTTIVGTLSMGSTATLDNSGILQTAAQTNITSLGTLTNLQVDFINANASTLTITDSSDTGDLFSIATTTHGATTITTVDDDAHAANLLFTLDGDFTVDNDGFGLTKFISDGFEIENHSASGTAALTIDNDDIDQIALDVDASNTTANIIDINAQALTTGDAIFIDANALTTGSAINIDVDDVVTTTATKSLIQLDYLKPETGASQISTTTGLDINFNGGAGVHGSSTVNMTGVDVALDVINNTGTVVQTGYSATLTDGDVATTVGYFSNVEDGGIDFKAVSSVDTGDMFTMSTTTHGATTLATNDDDAAAAHFKIQADGNITLESGADSTTHVAIDHRKFGISNNIDGNATGDIVYFGGTTSMTTGAIYHYKSDGTWELADADAVATCDGLLGVALGAASDTNGVLLRGMVTLDHDPGAVGDVLYVSTTAGDASATAPSGTGDIVRIIGYCLHASNGQVWFNPDSTFVEIS